MCWVWVTNDTTVKVLRIVFAFTGQVVVCEFNLPPTQQDENEIYLETTQ